MRIILAYNFSAERLRALKLAALLAKAQVRAVDRADLLQPLGYLAGVKGCAAAEEKYAGEEAQEEMIYLSGFDRPSLDRLLSAIKKGALRHIALKSMQTPTNVSWSGLELMRELRDEHEYMQKIDKKIMTIHQQKN